MIMDLHRYDVVITKLYGTGSVQNKIRPCVVVSNERGTSNASIITVMPLTSVIKKGNLPVHECLEADGENGLLSYSMIIGEQPHTICKGEIIKKMGTISNQEQRKLINRVCYNSFFYGEDINWEEVFGC